MANLQYEVLYWIYFRWEVRCLFDWILMMKLIVFRTFDVDTQRTLEEIQRINLLPAQEFPTDRKGIEFFVVNLEKLLRKLDEILNIFINKSVKEL